MAAHEQYGLVVCASIEDYFNDIIKKHEFTRPDKENDRIKHMDTLSYIHFFGFVLLRRGKYLL